MQVSFRSGFIWNNSMKNLQDTYFLVGCNQKWLVNQINLSLYMCVCAQRRRELISFICGRPLVSKNNRNWAFGCFSCFLIDKLIPLFLRFVEPKQRRGEYFTCNQFTTTIFTLKMTAKLGSMRWTWDPCHLGQE